MIVSVSLENVKQIKSTKNKEKKQHPLSLQKYSVCVTNGNPFHVSSFFTDKPDESNEEKKNLYNEQSKTS